MIGVKPDVIKWQELQNKLLFGSKPARLSILATNDAKSQRDDKTVLVRIG